MKHLISIFTIGISLAIIVFLSYYLVKISNNDIESSVWFQEPSNGVIPNIVHYVLFRQKQISFIHFISIRSVQLNHRPEKILIHCDCDDFEGEYWNRLNRSNITVVRMEEPKTIFGYQLTNVFHASDIARIRVLMKHGGIYFDTDVFVVKPLNTFLKYEMTIGWPVGQNLGNQVLIARKDARFLKLWLDTYKHYNGSLWYYNAGVLPTQSVLETNPGLVNRVSEGFGVRCCGFVRYLFVDNVDEKEWKKYYTVHMLYRWRWQFIKNASKEIEEKDVFDMRTTFGQMARSVLLN